MNVGIANPLKHFKKYLSISAISLINNIKIIMLADRLQWGSIQKEKTILSFKKLIFTYCINLLLIDISVRTKMPSQSILNSAEEITYLHHVVLTHFL